MVPKLPVVLASASPRRSELLQKLIPSFSVVPAELDEEALTVADPWETARCLALAKAQAVNQFRPESLVIGSDTVVALSTEPDTYVQFAKPADDLDAARMLNQLSGRSHMVITGVALVSPKGFWVDADTTEVTFRELSRVQIDEYIATGEPMDKAGAYAIQGGAARFVERVEGSISNVIGLPLELLERMLGDLGMGPEG